MPSSPAKRAARPAGFFAASFVAGWAGQLTFYEPAQVSLIWPLAGVALIWLLTATTHSLMFEAGLLTVAVALSVLVGVGGLDRAIVGAVITVAPTLVMVAVLRRFGRWPLRGEPLLASLPDLWPLSAAIVVGGVLTAALRTTGLGLIAPTGLNNASLTAVRSVAWAFTIGVLGLLWMARRPPESRPRTRTPRTPRALWYAECVLVATLTVAVTWEVFSRSAPLPILYPLFLAVVWACLRTSVAVAVSISSAIGVASVCFTLAGSGPFAAVTDPRTGAVLAQGFLVCLTLVALTLSLARNDRQSALDASRATAAIAEDRAALLDAVIGNIQEGIMLVQDDDSVTLANAASTRLVTNTGSRGSRPGGSVDPMHNWRGLNELDLNARSENGPYQLWDATGQPVPLNMLPSRRAIDGHSDGPRDFFVLRGTEVVRIVETHAVKLPTHEADPRLRAVVTFRDVTTERAHRSELESFAGVVAHDLANPLTVVRGWSEALLADTEDREELPAAQVNSVAHRIVSAATHMHTFINDLLSYTVTRNQELRVSDVDLTQLANEVAHLRRSSSNAQVRIDPHMQVCGDAALLRQLLDNLIGNAIKYVAPGTTPSVNLTASREGDWLTVVVADNGIGIPVADRSRIFDDFYRVESEQSRYRGTGLGLAICRRVVARHGGDIWVVPTAAEAPGTRIAFTLPTNPDAIPEMPPASDHPLSG